MTRDVARDLRALAPIHDEQAAMAWQLFLSGEGNERAHTAELLDVLLWQAVAKD
jgi:hypothetical protein